MSRSHLWIARPGRFSAGAPPGQVPKRCWPRCQPPSASPRPRFAAGEAYRDSLALRPTLLLCAQSQRQASPASRARLQTRIDGFEHCCSLEPEGIRPSRAPAADRPFARGSRLPATLEMRWCWVRAPPMEDAGIFQHREAGRSTLDPSVGRRNMSS